MVRFVGSSAREAAPHLLALLADGDADSRGMLRIPWHGYRVQETWDGRAALAKAITLKPDVIVTGDRMPFINGYELCRLLRSDPATETLAIIMVSGDAFEGGVRRAQVAGVDTVLIKPCLPETLQTEIKRLATRSAALRERSRVARGRIPQQIAKSDELMQLSRTRRQVKSHSHDRFATSTPPLSAPALVCPECDSLLRYDHSHVGGVSTAASEQWDYYTCLNGCGAFQYRQRNRKVRRV